MMIKLNVLDYCQNCKDFEPETTNIDTHYIGNTSDRVTLISCRNEVKCRALYDHLKNEMLKNQEEKDDD